MAHDFTEIGTVLQNNDDLRGAIIALIASQPISGKVTEGDYRLAAFRVVLTDLVNGTINLDQTFQRTEIELSPRTSPHGSNNRVFASGWAERLVRIQLSRFYNQAVMEKLMTEGQTLCFVPHSTAEDASSPCSVYLAGSNQDLKTLYNRLVDSYANGNWTKNVKIPDHPHCTHVVTRAR